jgi:hypothetical protein
LQNMTAREFAEWMAYDSLAPFGERRADQRHAVLAWILASANSSETIARDAFLPPEIESDDEPEDEEEPWQAQVRVAEMITAAYGGKDMRQQ